MASLSRASCLALFALFAFAGAAVAQSTEEQETLDQGRALTQQFAAGEVAGIHARFDAQMSEALSLEQLTALHQQVQTELGTETEVLSEQAGEMEGLRVYLRVSRFSQAPDAPAETGWALDQEGGIAGFFIRPAQPEAPPQEG